MSKSIARQDDPKRISKRFWEKVDKDSECWNWQGCKLPKGYGQFSYKLKTEQSHRVSWMIHFGDIPDGMHVLHHCDNPGCVRPDHLFIGTNADNKQDMMNKNRQAKGSRLPHTILSENDITEIRELYKTNKYTQKQLGEMFSVDQSNICRIINRSYWKHI